MARLGPVGIFLAATMPFLALGCGSCESDRGAAPFVYPTACDVGQGSRAGSAWRLTEPFPGASFEMPIAMGHAGDGSGRLFVAERAGRIRVVHPDRRITLALDFSARVHPDFECGFLGLALHPRHAETGRLYTNYCTKRGDETYSIISEWRMRQGDRDLVDPSSERVLLEVRQPWDNHNGGVLAFGPDGFLYAGFGDGGSGDDPLNSGQDLTSLLGKILRLDVDDPGTATRPYGIPADNPFAGELPGAGGRPELYAWGLRNPWRMSFDRQTGELWVADVGQNEREEVNRVERGKNYGWKVMEGSICRPGGPANCDKSGLELPALEYDHSVGRSITGGYVYRGARLPALVGRYLYADYASRLLFAWRPGDPPPTEPLLVTPNGIASFGEDEAGELYLLDLEGGTLWTLEALVGEPAAPPPERLSETGCFADLTSLTPAAGILPYDVRWPFWSDGADKTRWVALPAGGRVAPISPAGASGGAWRFPVGTVFIKHFELATTSGQRRLETRFTIQEDLGVRGFTYRWNAEGTDATLLHAEERLAVTTSAGAFEWHFPSPTQCATCHRGRGVLGLDGYQLDTEVAEWARQGLLTTAAPIAEPHPLPSAEASTEARARSWLHVNCAYCHDGLGPSGTPLDLARDLPLGALAACDAEPQRGDAGLGADARLIVPGHPERSILWRRASVRDAHTMPPLGAALVDPAADAVRAWIAELHNCGR